MMKVCHIVLTCVCVFFSHHAESSTLGNKVPPAHIIKVMDAAKAIHGIFMDTNSGVRSLEDIMMMIEHDFKDAPQESADAYLSCVRDAIALIKPVGEFSYTIKKQSEMLFQWHRGDEGVPSPHIKRRIKEAFPPLKAAIMSFVQKHYVPLEQAFQQYMQQKSQGGDRYKRLLQKIHQDLAQEMPHVLGYLHTIQAYIDA